MALIATLTDTFATKDTAKWNWNTAASVSGGQAVLPVNSGYTAQITSVATYDLTSSAFFVQVVQAPNIGSGSTELFVRVLLDTNNFVDFYLTNGILNARRKVTGTVTSLGTVTYSAATMQFWRIRHTGSQIVCEYSANATSWTQLGSAWTPTFSITAVKADIYSGYWGTEATPGTVLLDNVNLVPDSTAPTVPGSVTATVNSATSVTVSWSASTDAVGVTSYRLRRNGVDVTGATAVAGTSFTDTTAIGNTAYSYTVSAVDAAGNRSAESSAATATTPRPFATAADWLWNPIPASPNLDANSAAMVTAMWGTTASSGCGLYDYGVVIIDAAQVTSSTVPPRYDVPLAHETGGSASPDIWGANPFGSGAYIPISESTKLPPMHATFDPAGQNFGDAHYSVIDPITSKIESLWQLERTAPNTYQASWGGVATITGDGRETAGSSTGGGLTRPAGVVRINELAAAAAANTGLSHALFLTTSQVSDAFRYPALKSDGQAGDAVPMGTRLQLDPSINVDAISGITAAEKVIAKTLQTHGAYVGDGSGNNAGIIFEFDQTATRSSPTTSANTTPGATYVSLGLTNDYFAMTHIPWTSMRALSTSTGLAPLAAPLSGSGTLTATVTPRLTQAVALTGVGTLSATATPGELQTVALSGSGTLTATVALSVALNAAASGAGELTARLSRRTWFFRTPTQEVWFPIAGRGLVGSYSQGLTVYRVDGQWRTRLSPGATELANADRSYQGGYLHQLTEAQRAELDAAGFSDSITIEEVLV